jgi:hypothetical protein
MADAQSCAVPERTNATRNEENTFMKNTLCALSALPIMVGQ